MGEATVCPNCGAVAETGQPAVTAEVRPVSRSDETVPPKKSAAKKKKSRSGLAALAVILVAAILLAAVGVVGYTQYRQDTYYSDMDKVARTMLNESASAEVAGNLIVSVWNNAIYQVQDEETDPYTMQDGKFVDDFNVALANLLSDEAFAQTLADLNSTFSDVCDTMKSLNNPPKKYEKAFSVLADYYFSYYKLVHTVVSVDGSLTSFSEAFGLYDNAAADAYAKMSIYLK